MASHVYEKISRHCFCLNWKAFKIHFMLHDLTRCLGQTVTRALWTFMCNEIWNQLLSQSKTKITLLTLDWCTNKPTDKVKHVFRKKLCVWHVSFFFFFLLQQLTSLSVLLIHVHKNTETLLKTVQSLYLEICCVLFQPVDYNDPASCTVLHRFHLGF